MLARSFAICALAYFVALGAAMATVYWLGGQQSTVPMTFWADVAATVAIFAFSVAFSNSSFYDAYWSIAPIAIAFFWALAPDSTLVPISRQALVLTLVSAWGLRLTWNWARGWQGLSHEDWRYVDMRGRTGSLYWPVSFAGLHMMPTLLVFGGCLALYPALSHGEQPLGPLDAIAAVVTAGAIWLEGTADNQLRRFRLTRPPPEAILESGLWAHARHPNYLGEILFWWGLYGFALAADPSAWWTGIGALTITLLFRFITVRLIDDRMLERRPGYKRRLETTPALIPNPFRPASNEG